MSFLSQMGTESGVLMMWNWLCGHSILPRSFNQSFLMMKAAAVSQQNTGGRKELMTTNIVKILSIETVIVKEIKMALHRLQRRENNDCILVHLTFIDIITIAK